MAKLPFVLKAEHPLRGKFDDWILESSQWEEVDTGVWGNSHTLGPDRYGVTLLSRDCGSHFHGIGTGAILEAIRQARRVREDQHEVDVARATGEVE